MEEDNKKNRKKIKNKKYKGHMDIFQHYEQTKKPFC